MFYKDKASIDIICISPIKEPQCSEDHTPALGMIIYPNILWKCSDRMKAKSLLRKG